MILQSLYEYYQRKAADPDSNIASPGFERKEIPFIIVIDKNGKFVNLEDTREGDGKRRIGQKFTVIKTKVRSGPNSWQISNILWDHYGYILGYPKDETDKAVKDAQKRHNSFISLVNQFAEAHPENEQFYAVKKFLDSESEKKKVLKHEAWLDCVKIPNCNMSFRVVGEKKIVAEHEDLRDCVAEINNEITDDLEKGEEIGTKEGICLITGQRAPIAILHHATPIPGGKSGGKIVGFQKKSGYDSYYKVQGLNAPISIKAEDAYTTALKVLLEKESRNKFNIAETMVIFWADKKSVLEDQMSFFFTNPEKDNPDRNTQEIKALFESVRSGKLNTEGDTQFYILGLAPNASRIVIRFWKTGKASDFSEKFVMHFSDLDIVRSKNDREYFTLFNLLSNIALEYKVDNLPPNLGSAVITSILDGTPYPSTLQQQCIRRIRAEQHVNRIRASILKAYLNRKNRIYKTKEKEIAMALDISNTNQGYLCGRLFAVLEKIQEEALGKATIKERFYGAASSTPVTVLSRLLNMSNHHLAKLNGGRRTNLEKLIQEIFSGISSNGMPAHLSLDDQSRFAIGYYHQRQDLFTSKEQKELINQ